LAATAAGAIFGDFPSERDGEGQIAAIKSAGGTASSEAIPATTVIRSAAVAPRVGQRCGFAKRKRTFRGTVIRVTPMRKAKTHVR
jgi:hypothetical protein